MGCLYSTAIPASSDTTQSRLIINGKSIVALVDDYRALSHTHMIFDKYIDEYASLYLGAIEGGYHICMENVVDDIVSCNKKSGRHHKPLPDIICIIADDADNREYYHILEVLKGVCGTQVVCLNDTEIPRKGDKHLLYIQGWIHPLWPSSKGWIHPMDT